MVFNAPVGWSGRIWGRTGCDFGREGNGTCLTGACGTSLKCGAAGKPPATLAEFTLAKVDFYDVSLVDGFNIPMAVKPLNGVGNCTIAGCDEDLRRNCPKELSVKSPDHGRETVACRSACDVFNTDDYCCRGVYGNPVTCHPNYYSKLFKQACPASYSYAYDDPTSIFTCSGTDYVVTFCSSMSQPVCTYHNNKLICSSGSMGFKSLLRRWRISEASRVFTLTNDCRETIWPAIIPGDSFLGGGFPLKQGQSRVFTAPIGWSGRIWARTGCNFDQSGNGTCATGACGTSLKCGAAGKPPATLAEFTLAKVDFYDVSLVDGFNIPVSIKPLHGAGNCTTAGCNQDLRKNCPKELSVKDPNDRSKTVACRSACDVFDTDEYCCRGLYGGPSVCHPTYYSKLFKQACPTSYSYAYDDPTSIFTCTGTDYIITFCSS
uniref:Thaumatin-like protein n=1 Tax=Chenopodium quinoa TaxID=63459 RepID=A0A803L0A4_CHEQI